MHSQTAILHAAHFRSVVNHTNDTYTRRGKVVDMKVTLLETFGFVPTPCPPIHILNDLPNCPTRTPCYNVSAWSASVLTHGSQGGGGATWFQLCPNVCDPKGRIYFFGPQGSKMSEDISVKFGCEMLPCHSIWVRIYVEYLYNYE